MSLIIIWYMYGSRKSKTNQSMFWMIYVMDSLPHRRDIVLGHTDTIRYMSYKVNTLITYIYTWNSKQPVFSWLFQLDDSRFLTQKWLFTKQPLKKWLFRVPGTFFPVSRLRTLLHEAREKFQQQVLQAMEDSKERHFFVLLPTIHWFFTWPKTISIQSFSEKADC